MKYRYPDSVIDLMLAYAEKNEKSLNEIVIYCKSDIREELAKQFETFFLDEYSRLMDLVEDQAGDCTEKDDEYNPLLGFEMAENGVKVFLDSLLLHYCDGDYYFEKDGYDALDISLKKLKTEYPSISYEGFGFDFWQDVSCGELDSREISSMEKNNAEIIAYDLVGERLCDALQDDEMWDYLAKSLIDADEHEFKKILDVFQVYSKWIPPNSMERLAALRDN